MGKLSLILYIGIAICLLLFLSLSRNHDDHHQNPSRRHGQTHRRLKLKSNFTFTSQDHLEHHDPHHDPRHEFHHHHHDHIPFDPLIADMERHREDKEWERMYFDEHHPEFSQLARQHDHDHHESHHHHHHHHHEEDHHHHQHHDHHEEQHHEGQEWGEFDDPEEYLNDEEKFNVTDRIVHLFPQIDVDPKDGFVSENELTNWNLEQAVREVLHRSQREMELHDKNHDGFVSLAEYEPPSWVNSSDHNSFGYEIGWWKEEHFNASDMNGDGLLNLTEFNDFLHPADTKNPKLLQWLCKEEIRERDTDKDGKINYNEFFHGLFDLVRTYEEEGHNTTHHSDNSTGSHADNSTDSHAAKKLFNQLDKDSDGLLTDTELLPIIGKLHPSEHYYAKQQADYVISQADIDKDGRLSLAEMLENPYVFYSSVFSDEEEYDYDYDYRDELR